MIATRPNGSFGNRPMRRIFSWGVVLFGVLAVALLVIPILDPSSQLDCLHEDVDHCTGRCRISRSFAFCKVSERGLETSLSRVVPRELFNGAMPQWARVSTVGILGSGGIPMRGNSAKDPVGPQSAIEWFGSRLASPCFSAYWFSREFTPPSRMSSRTVTRLHRSHSRLVVSETKTDACSVSQASNCTSSHRLV